MIPLHVAIVGGGVSGLSAAHRLRLLLGERVTITVLEQAGQIGGKLRTVEFGGRRFDMGAEAFLARRPEATELITELGMADDLVHPTGAVSTIRAGGRDLQMPTRTVMGVPASAEAVRDVLSADAYARVAAEPELPPLRLFGADVSVGALLRERFGSEVTDRLVDPLLGGVYAGRADALGLRATLPAIAAALDGGMGSLVDAAAAAVPVPQQKGARRLPVFGTLRAGLGSLTDRLAAVSGARIRPDTTVRALHRTATGWRVETGPVSRPGFLDVDAVLLAVPPPSARRLLADIAPTAAAAFAGVDVASVAVVSLALPPGVVLPASSGALIAAGERHADGTPFTAKAFTYSSRKWAHLNASGGLVVRGSVGRCGEIEVLQRDDDELVAAVTQDLAELTGITARPVETMVIRWGGGMPQYGVGHLDAVRTLERAVAEVPGLEVAGATLHGVGVPACVATSDAAAARIASHLIVRPRSASGTMGSWPA